jgi:hypothetical protein
MQTDIRHKYEASWPILNEICHYVIIYVMSFMSLFMSCHVIVPLYHVIVIYVIVIYVMSLSLFMSCHVMPLFMSLFVIMSFMSLFMSLFALVKRCPSRCFINDGYKGVSNLSPLILYVGLE